MPSTEAENAEKIMKAFDFYSQIYCSKFEKGQMDEVKDEANDYNYVLGAYKMVRDIRDESYKTPIKTLSSKQESGGKPG